MPRQQHPCDAQVCAMVPHLQAARCVEMRAERIQDTIGHWRLAVVPWDACYPAGWASQNFPRDACLPCRLGFAEHPKGCLPALQTGLPRTSQRTPAYPADWASQNIPKDARPPC
eukprot:366517-Chlamydomonas_euryale.AAC.6